MTKLEITKASEVKVREIEWLWYPYIPFGKVTIIQGDAGDGKSSFVLTLAAMLSQGQPMPFTDGTGQSPILTEYVRQRGWHLVQIYVDDGYSGTNFVEVR